LKPTHCLSDFMRVLKGESSEWIHNELQIPIFQWQEGYGAFTVSPSARKRVESYIRNQERHHRTKSFQEEYVELLQQAGIEYDEKYLW
jgi:putative transposase